MTFLTEGSSGIVWQLDHRILGCWCLHYTALFGGQVARWGKIRSKLGSSSDSRIRDLFASLETAALSHFPVERRKAR